MKRYEKPYVNSYENLNIEDIMFVSGINFNDDVLDFGTDIDGGDEIW